MMKGHHYINVELNEVILFIRKNKSIPLVDVAQSVEDIDYKTVKLIGYDDADYDMYEE